jgi:hypothetical protein
MADDLWETAFRKLNGDTASLLQPPGSSIDGSVRTLIEEIEEIKKKKKDRENAGWSIILPAIPGRKPKVVNLRRMVYSIMEAAFAFNDIVTKILAFDTTKYGMSHYQFLSCYERGTYFGPRCSCMVYCFFRDECKDYKILPT